MIVDREPLWALDGRLLGHACAGFICDLLAEGFEWIKHNAMGAPHPRYYITPELRDSYEEWFTRGPNEKSRGFEVYYSPRDRGRFLYWFQPL